MFRKYLFSMLLVVAVIFLSLTVGMMICLKENFFLGLYHATVGIYREIGLKGILVGVLLYPLALSSAVFFARVCLGLRPLHVMFMATSVHLILKIIGLFDYIAEAAGGAVIVVAVPATVLAVFWVFYIFVLN